MDTEPFPTGALPFYATFEYCVNAVTRQDCRDWGFQITDPGYAISDDYCKDHQWINKSIAEKICRHHQCSNCGIICKLILLPNEAYFGTMKHFEPTSIVV